ncbi:MAG TPA: sensor histidine kinase [Actinomycetota bacterium]|nr:sensor histidine kinase [Actinomycetota bacterium]
MDLTTNQSRPREDRFRHEALVYDGPDAFAGVVGPFVADALAADEPVLVMTPPDRIDTLRRYLGDDAARVRFEDMTGVGRNPARIIPAWQAFAEEHSGRSVRGVGEPAWAGRSPDELEECRLHESLINLAFRGSDGFWLACPYDGSSLDAPVLEDAHRTHPLAGGTPLISYAGVEDAAGLFAEQLPVPPASAERLDYDNETARSVRRFATEIAQRAGLDAVASANFALTAHELAINSVVHGGGGGTIDAWITPTALIGEVRDRGLIADPLTGRIRPSVDVEGGRGIWLANQLCDLVQLRSSRAGTSVRFHVARSGNTD